MKTNLEDKIKLQKTEFDEYRSKVNDEIKGLVKSVKLKEKELYNTNKKLNNSLDTVSNIKTELSLLKSEDSPLRKDMGRLKKQLEKCQSKRRSLGQSCQTESTIDLPYSVTEDLPPIFGSGQSYVSSLKLFICQSLYQTLQQ